MKILLAILLYATLNINAQHEETNTHLDWTYEGEMGPEHWAELEKKSDCNGHQQSPINIVNINVVKDLNLEPLEMHYSKNVKIHDISNNGHTLQYNFEHGDFIVIDDENYELKQIHFHEAAEHTIDGIRYPLEMHMVHVSKTKKIAVLAILAKEGKPKAPFTFLESYLPVYTGEVKEINSTFDLNRNLPKNKTYYTYKGSLTTPPCSQNITWFIFKHPITISVEQVKQIQKLMPHDNYRGEQPLNNRKVYQYTFKK